LACVDVAVDILQHTEFRGRGEASMLCQWREREISESLIHDVARGISGIENIVVMGSEA
jgi:hypothetical protein